MRMVTLTGILWVILANGTFAQVCSEIEEDAARLACFDAAFPRKVVNAVDQPTPIVSKWQKREEVSKVDDSRNVYLFVDSNGELPLRYGGYGAARLHVRCLENTTAAIVEFADHFMSDIQGYGDVTYRVDKKPAGRKAMTASTDNSTLGLWNGGTSIPFIKSLFGGTTLFVRATPFNETPVEVEFTIAGLEQAITPLRQACHW